MMCQLRCAAAMAFLLSGCSANLGVDDITAKTSYKNINGIPFRTDKPFVAHVFHKTDGGYVEIGKYPVTIPDQSHLYVLHFNGEAFANGSVDLTLNDDGTIQTVTVKSTASGQTDLTAAGTQLSGIATAISTARTTETTNRNAAQDALVTAERSKAAADVAILQNQTTQASGTASSLEILQAAQAERLAKITANIAAVRAGLPPYYPDVPSMPQQ